VHALTHGDPVQRLEPQPGAHAPVLVVSDDQVLSGEVAASDVSAAGDPVLSPRDVEALAVLLYTSGTSGRPRGAMLTHRALLANIDSASRTDPPPVSPDDIVLGVLPLSHIYGLNAVLGQVLLHGATLVLGRRFDSEETLRLIAAEHVTCVPVAPPVIAAWLRRDDAPAQLASVRTVLSGAAPLADRVVAAFRERTGLTVEQGYGLTEAAPVVTSTIGTPTFKPGSTGRALPGVEVRVVDDAGRDAGPDDPGEIWVRGRNLFSGYWPDGDGAPEPGGWLATGDIGFLDGDGDLFLVDRLKELVIVSGFNVYPSEIEDVVCEVAGVRECAVIGVPDETTGEAVIAYVVSEPAHPGGDEALVLHIREHCAQRLARFKVPVMISVVTDLPHSATGKVAKGRLRAANARRALGLA
jgi:long-chain acyl-CoA synthetase